VPPLTGGGVLLDLLDLTVVLTSEGARAQGEGQEWYDVDKSRDGELLRRRMMRRRNIRLKTRGRL